MVNYIHSVTIEIHALLNLNNSYSLLKFIRLVSTAYNICLNTVTN